MATIGNNSDTFLDTLSGFWHRFFRDLGDIQAVYEGQAILLGQVYLDLLTSVLSTGVLETPLFRKEYYKLFTIREDQIVYRDGQWVFVTSETYSSLPKLQNTVFRPTAALEEGLVGDQGYDVLPDGIGFHVDPTDPIPSGYASREVDVAVSGFFSATSVADWVVAGAKKGDLLYLSPTVDLSVSGALTGITPLRVVRVEVNRLALALDTPLPQLPASPVEYSWSVGALNDGSTFDGRVDYTPAVTVREIALWAVDAQVDDYTLYENFGHMFGRKQVSSELYRAFIRGVMQLYIMGPAIQRLESALNVVANLPVVVEDGEVLQSYDSGLDQSGVDGVLDASTHFVAATAAFDESAAGGFVKVTDAFNAVNIRTLRVLNFVNPTTVELQDYPDLIAEAGLTWEFSATDLQTVVTDKNTYTYPRDIPMRADVVAVTSGLTFRTFEPLTTAIRVMDYVSDPEWWHNITIPPDILDWPAYRRVSSPQVWPTTIGEGHHQIGDPGFYVGADEFGQTPIDGEPYLHNAAFILLDRFLKAHMFGVVIAEEVDLTGVLIQDMTEMLRAAKPATTYLYVEAQTLFTDEIAVAEEFLRTARLPMTEGMTQIDNLLRVGGGWTIGQTWDFALGSGGVLVGPGEMALCIGGSDPNIVEPATDPGPFATQADDPGGQIVDRALHIHAHA